MIPLKFSEPTICRFFASISQRFKMFPRLYFRVIPRSKNYAYAARSPRQLPAAAGRYYADRAKEFELLLFAVRQRRDLGKFRQNVARFRQYRHRFLQENRRFAAFFKIYRDYLAENLKFGNILQILRHNDLQFFC